MMLLPLFVIFFFSFVMFYTISRSVKMAATHTHLIFISMISSTVIALQASGNYLPGNETVTLPTSAESYFRTTMASNLLYTHMALMSVSWIVALPICLCPEFKD
jgi:hypothetical protein